MYPEKAKLQKYEREMSYDGILENWLLQMFEYNGFPDYFRVDLFEKILLRTGRVAIANVEGMLLPMICDFTGDLKTDGDLSDVVCFTQNSKEYRFEDWVNNENVQVFFNTKNRSSDMNVGYYGYMLSETDTSLKNNLIFSRCKPFPIARNEQEKQKIDIMLSHLSDGELKSIVKPFTAKDIAALGTSTVGTDGIDIINLTDVTYSQNIQYLSKFYSVMTSRFLSLYGFGMWDSGKQAQMTESEVCENDCAGFLLPDNMLYCRQRDFNTFNRKFNMTISVKFCEMLERQRRKTEIPAEDAENVSDQKEGADNEN